MEDLQTQTPEPAKITNQVSRGRRGVVLNLALCVIVIAAMVGGVYYWQHQKVSDLSKKNASLTSQLVTAQKADKPAQHATVPASNAISYKASVGKFTLTLPNKYVIIVGNDGGGEGGPSTALTIGESTSTQGVVNSPNFTPVTVGAAPLHGRTFRNAVDSDPDLGNVIGKSTTQVDGVTAETYMVGNIGASKYVYFTRDSIFYKVAYEIGAESTSNPTLDTVIAGFKFN